MHKQFLFVCVCVASLTSNVHAQTCESDVRRLEAAIAGNLIDTIEIMPNVISPPRRTALGVPLHQLVPVLEVNATNAWLDGNRVDANRLEYNLAALRRNWRIVNPDIPFRNELYVWADTDLSTSRLDVVVQPAVARGYTIVLLARLPERTYGACPAGWENECRRLESTTRSEHSIQLANMSSELILPCPSLAQFWSRLPGYRVFEQSVQVQRRAPDALRECGCSGVNMERMIYLMPELLSLRERATGVVYTGTATNQTVGEWMRGR